MLFINKANAEYVWCNAMQFAKKDEADRCLAAAIGATDPAHARDEGGSCIYLGSRALHVTRAVDREQVRL